MVGLCTCKSKSDSVYHSVNTTDGVCNECGYYAVMGSPLKHTSEEYNGTLKKKFQTDEYSLPSYVKEVLIESGNL